MRCACRLSGMDVDLAGWQALLLQVCVQRPELGPSIPLWRRQLSPPPPCPTSPSPPPSPGPSPDNPLGITPLLRRSDNIFLIIGDWGKDGYRGCQHRVAQLMKDYVSRQQAQGKKCLFVGVVGDKFYTTSLQNDGYWQWTWSDVHGVNDSSSPLHDTPWLALIGNHDMGNSDPACACGQGCKQLNGANRRAGTKMFCMPEYHWHYYTPGVDLEIIGLDTNAVDVDGLGGNGCSGVAAVTCRHCVGINNIRGYLNTKKSDGEALSDQRARVSNAKTSLLMQHREVVRQPWCRVQDSLRKRQRPQGEGSVGIWPQARPTRARTYCCDLILTGGGCGWQGGAYFGFTAVHLTDDGGQQTVLETSEVHFSQKSCKYLNNVTSVVHPARSNRVSITV
mmetsp:Transcript_56669/g.184396  ORF Transcript_56669/g.184396 Transcript_56669/m.184396 type:complete len:392 (-) Transcript_56669:469-1644(-)